MARIRSLSDDLAREGVVAWWRWDGQVVALAGVPSRLLAHPLANGLPYFQPPLKLSFYRGLLHTAAGNRCVFLF
jgi:hypothetical protein